MKNSTVLKVILILLGLVLTILGSWRLIDPVAFFENSGLLLSNDVGLLNEARATGGVVVGFAANTANQLNQFLPARYL